MSIANFFQRDKSPNEESGINENAPIILVSGENVALNPSNYITYSWPESDYTQKLEFTFAYELEHVSWDDGIRDCVYKINGREFKDLSCMKGKPIKTFEKTYDKVYEIRGYDDGERFLYHYHSVPTFDSGDREWDSACDVAVIRDKMGLHIIHCQSGYRVPRINIYLQLKKSNAEFDKWIERLNWQDYNK